MTATTEPLEWGRSFRIPTQATKLVLNAVSGRSGRGVIVKANAVDGICIHQARGSFTPCEALRHLLGATGLMATSDERNRALFVHRADSP